MLPFTIVRAEAGDLIDLRHRILRQGFGREEAIFPGDDEMTSIHLAALDSSSAVIGCVTLHLNQWQGEEAYQLRGMAVESAHQRAGIGASLLRAVDAAVIEAKTTRLLWCNARTPVIPFYARHGWEVASDVFDIPASGPHVKMVKRLT